MSQQPPQGPPPGWQAPPMRHDMHMESYKSAKAFQKHAPLMRQAGWQIGPHHEQRGRATVTWYRDVPPSVPPDANIPPQPHGGMPLWGWIIIGVVGLFVLIGIIGSASGGGKTATATSGNAVAAIPTPRSPAIAPSVAGATGTQPAATPPSAAAVAATATGIPATATPAATPVSATPAPTPSAPAAPAVAPTASVPMVVTVKDSPANVRQAADPNSAAIATVPVGADLFVIGADATGTDGTTRWVPVQAEGKNGFVRSDLVTERHIQTPTPMPPTATTDPNAPVTARGKTLAITLRGGKDPVPPGQFGSNKPGYRYIAYDVTVEDIGSAPESYSILFASVKTTDDRKYGATIAITVLDPNLSGGTLAPGERNRGWLIFEIPVGAKVASLNYDDFTNRIGFTAN